MGRVLIFDMKTGRVKLLNLREIAKRPPEGYKILELLPEGGLPYHVFWYIKGRQNLKYRVTFHELKLGNGCEGMIRRFFESHGQNAEEWHLFRSIMYVPQSYVQTEMTCTTEVERFFAKSKEGK